LLLFFFIKIYLRDFRENYIFEERFLLKRKRTISRNGFDKWQADVLTMRINWDAIRHGWGFRSQFQANRNQRTWWVRIPLLICGLNRGWIRRARRLDDSLTRTILLCFVPAIDPSRRAAASANAWKPLSSYSRFGRVNGITRPFKGRKSNYVISWLRYAEEAVAMLDDGVSDRIGDGWRTVLRRVKVDRESEYRSKE